MLSSGYNVRWLNSHLIPFPNEIMSFVCFFYALAEFSEMSSALKVKILFLLLLKTTPN